MTEPHETPASERSASLGGASAGLPGAVSVGRPSFLGTEEGVYGVILVAGMIVVSNTYESTSLRVFVTVVSTVVVFWAAHVFAGTIALTEHPDGRPVGLRQSFRRSLRRCWGLLVSALIPASILLFGALHWVSDEAAIWAALWVCVVVLAILGYLAFQRRGSPWPIRVLGAVATAGFGIVMILLKAAVH